MCGRYTLSSPSDELALLFDLSELSPVPPRYNLAPTQEAAVVRVAAPGEPRRLDLLKWGLIPYWAQEASIGNRMINARAESVAEKPAYRWSFKKKRCLIPADGFYEWQRTNGAKQPFYIHMQDGRPFAFAGLWESWERGAEGAVRTCAILTTEANALVGEVHERMPVIVAPDAYDVWLDPASERDELIGLLGSYPEDEMEAYPVSRFVNSPSNNDPRCIEPAA
jgi:putative SOS response-associated peptidase YedK